MLFVLVLLFAVFAAAFRVVGVVAIAFYGRSTAIATVFVMLFVLLVAFVLAVVVSPLTDFSQLAFLVVLRCYCSCC